MPIATCPSREELIDYVVGKLTDEASDGLASHLDECPQCQAELATLPDPDDTLIARLRGTAPPDPFQDEPGCGRAVAQALAVGEHNGSAADLPRQLGEYQLLQRLGSGGMGTVYKARQSRLDRVVALKILLRGRTDDPRAIIRFEREMKAIGRLDHPNIVRAYDAREIDGTPVLIMEFVDGLDLAEIVRRCGAGCQPAKQIGNLLHGIPIADACELVRRTALALQCAHDHGLVHRDIKPSNIMLARSGEVKLLDLGLARFLAGDCPSFCVSKNGTVPFPAATEEATGTGQAMGTADYMAPEQASDSRTVDIRADIYSLGCTLYKLLSGRAPFSGPEYCATLDKMNAHVQKPPPSIRQFAPDVPERLAAVLARMLAKDPSARFSTPAEVAEAITPFCAGADLPALLNRAETSGVEASAASESNNLPSPSGKGAGGEGRRWKRFAGQIVALAVVGGLCFALGVLITIKRNGQTYQIEAPPGSRTAIAPNGNATVEIAEGRVGASRPVVVNPAADLKALQGQWNVAAVQKGNDAAKAMADILEFLGSPLDPADLYRLDFRQGPVWEGSHHDSSLFFVLDPRIWSGEYNEAVLSYRIDPTATPKTMDIFSITADGGVGGGMGGMGGMGGGMGGMMGGGMGGSMGMASENENLKALAIYELQGDHLKIAMRRYSPSVASDQRPKRFAVEPDSDAIILHLDRYHPSADDKTIQDNWAVMSQVNDGKSVPPEELRGRSWYFADYFVTMNYHARDKEHRNGLGTSGQWVLNATKQPKTISILTYDWEHADGKKRTSKPTDFHGIYKFDGDRLTIAYRKNGPPPEKFESAPGSGVTLLVLEKVKPEPAGGFSAIGKDHAKATPAAPPPTIRVTQPVVCNVCDYEEYSGRIEKGVLHVFVPPKMSLCARLGWSVNEGDLLGVEAEQKEVREAYSALSALINMASNETADLDARLKAARGALGQALRNHPAVKRVVAPCSGKVVQIEPVQRNPVDEIGDSVELASSDSMLVTFDIPESTVLAHRRVLGRKPNWELSLPVVCALADDKGFPYRGKIVSVAEGIDPKTHTQRWQAVVPNKDGIFMPGMSVRVRVITSEPHRAILLPPDCRVRLLHSESGDLRDAEVMVVTSWNVVESRKVKIGRQQYDRFVPVTDGLNGNEWVVMHGASETYPESYHAGLAVKPEKVTTPPPPWASVDLTPPAAPPAVSVVHPIARDVTDYQQFRGYIVAARSAEIRARVTGNLLKVHVKPGMAVKQGDLLFEIDPRLYQSEVDHAASAVKEAQVRLDQRTKELKRFEQLLKSAAVSQDEYDRVKSQCEEAAAAIKTAEAAMTIARLRLDFTKVTAPFNGKITGGLLDDGNLVTADVTQLTTISSTDPVSVQIYMPTTVLAKIRGNGHGGPDPALSLPVFCRLTGDKGYDYRAKMDSIESSVEAGGSVVCRAVLANKEDRFAPGMTVDVRVAIGGPHKALLVPERSLKSDVDGRFVFVLNDRNVVERRDVEIGGLQDDGLRVITKGANAEDWVVTSGVQKLQPGMTVTPEKAGASPP